MLRPGLLFIALFCAGIGTGGAYTTYFDFKPSAASPDAWVRLLQHAIRTIGVPLFIVQPLAFVTCVVSAGLAFQDGPSFYFLAAASGCFLMAALATRLGNIPINHQIVTWNPDALPADFAQLQARWWNFHVFRFAALGVGLASLIVGAMTRGR